MLAASILGTGSALPARRVATSDLLAEIVPYASAQVIEARIGIQHRHWLGEGETAAGLAAQAVGRALEAAGVAPSQIRRIVLVTSTGGDQMIPATAHGVADALGIDGECDAFDLNNACAGFLTGFDVAARSVVTGVGPAVVVAVETFSRKISPAGRRAYLVLADAAAAAVVGPARSATEGLLASVLRSSSDLRGKMVMPHADRAGGRGYHDFDTDGAQITETAIALIEESVGIALEKARLRLADIDWVLPHQPNGEIFRLLSERLGVSSERMVPVFPDAGSLGSASVPLSLDRLMRRHSVRPGARILLTAVGSGTTHGAIIYQVAS